MRPLPHSLIEALAAGGEGMTLLVVRLGALGDVVRTLPAVRLVRRGLPGARLVWVVEERSSPAIDGHRDLDGVVVVPRREWERLGRSPAGWPGLGRSLVRLGRALRRLEADLVLDFHGNLRSGLVGRMTGAPVRIGYAGRQQREGNRLLTTHRVDGGPPRTPRTERNLGLVRALGLPDAPLPAADTPLVARGRAEAARVLAGTGLAERAWAILSPGASARQAYKRPPPALLAAAAAELACAGVASLVVWGPGEREDARRVVEASEGVALEAPPTSLAELAGLAERARLFVGGDSGPLHLACAAGCPVVGLYGPTDPEVNRPWGVPCRALAPAGRVYTGIKRVDRASGGFEGLEAVEVARATRELLSETAARERGRAGGS